MAPKSDQRPMPKGPKAAKKSEDGGWFNGAKHLIPGWCVMLVVIAWAGINFVTDAVRIFNIIRLGGLFDVTAFDVARIANDICSIILCLLVFGLWLTICFKFVFMRHIWSWRTWIFTDTMMPGGFVPRPSAVSVGLLMFLTQVFISERVVPGDKLYERDHEGFYTNSIAHGESCRADVREESHYKDDWFSRFQRSNPAGCYFGECDEHSSDMGCHSGGIGPSIPKIFTTVLAAHNASVSPDVNVVHPYHMSTHIVMNMYQAAQHMLPSIFGHRRNLNPEELYIDTDNTCLYQCVKWRVWGFNGVVSKGGVITAGAAVVTKMTQAITGFCGYMRVTEDTSEEVLTALLDKTKPNKDGRLYRMFHKSSLVPAVIFVGVRLFFGFWVYKIDDAGFFTVDFYVSQVLLFSIFSAFVLRSWNPFRWERVVYTHNLWEKGCEKFMVIGLNEDGKEALKPKEIDLYVWLHMSHEERAYLLINFARQVSTKAVLANGARVESLATQKFEASSPVIPDKAGKALPWGAKKVMELKSLKVARHARVVDKVTGETTTFASLPQGKVVKLDSGMVHVKWEVSHIHPDDANNSANQTYDKDPYDKNQEWIKMLQEQFPDDVERALTSAVEPMHLVEVTDEFQQLMNHHVPLDSLEGGHSREEIIDKILKRVEADKQMKSARGIRQWMCCQESTKVKAAKKTKKEDRLKKDKERQAAMNGPAHPLLA